MSNDPIMEREANYFAMCLLMPEAFLRKDIQALGGIDIEDDKTMSKLAKKYGVSITMLTLRLGQLGVMKSFG